MSERSGTARVRDAASALRGRIDALARDPERLMGSARNGLKDAMAGVVASVALIANIVSFGALMFPGEFSAGIPIAIWAMLIGSCIGGLWIALATSLPPIATGIDSPTGIVLVLLSAAASSGILAAGGTPQAAVHIVMLIFTVATFVSGILFYALGVFKAGTYFRFIPYFVVGGFLAATAWFLAVGGVRMALGRAPAISDLATWTWSDTAKLLSALSALAVLLALRRWVKWPFATPMALIAMWLFGALALQSLGLSDPAQGWYFRSLGSLVPWSPIEAAYNSQPPWGAIIVFLPEMVAVTIVAIISLITKVASLEVSRQVSGDLDCEFRSHGVASLIVVPLGGLIGGLQIGSSRLLELAGGASRQSGVMCALVLGVVGLANFDLPGMIPIPIVAGLVFFLGYTFFIDALWQPYSQRAWFDLGLALAIMVVCVRYGYLVGVLAGILGACVMFAISYARIGAVRQHITRSQFASYVDRSADASQYLREAGDAIQIYWLSGYIFFGSSEGVFERIRGDIERLPPGGVAYVVLDFSMVSGTDSSAIVSVAKLRRFCELHGTTLVYCSLAPDSHAILERRGFFGGKSRHRAFSDLNLGLAWCEDQLLAKAKAKPDTDASIAGFEAWLQKQLGGDVTSADLIGYLERKDFEGSQVLYRQGEPADTVDLIARGNLAIEVARDSGETVRVRRITTHTVVGEMGFHRNMARSATVSSEGPVTLFTLTRANFERMRRERPDVANAYEDFILRVLADRIDFANRTVAALTR